MVPSNLSKFRLDVPRLPVDYASYHTGPRPVCIEPLRFRTARLAALIDR